MPFPCPSVEVLEALAAGNAVDQDSRDHIASCPRCADGLAEIKLNADFLKSAGTELKGLIHGRWGENPSPTRADAVPGYSILGVIQRGGQGVVYRALQTATKRKVALKMPLRGELASQRERHRFEREIEIVASLRHPNIVTVFDSGITPDGRFFVAMEYIHGLSLDAFVRDRLHQSDQPPRLQLVANLKLLSQIAAAVQHAHARGVIHRDLKPANILVDQAGEPRIVDFGLARSLVLARGANPTITHEFMGTPAYASPEQVAGDPDRIDARTDVYSLGVIMYEMIVGRPPYQIGASVIDAARTILDVEPERPRRIVPRLPDEVETIILKALAKDPERRYHSAGALCQDIQDFLAGRAISARRDSTWYVVTKAARRHRTLVAAGASIAAAVVIGLVMTSYSLYRVQRERDKTQAALSSEAAAKHEANVQKDAALSEAARSRQMSEFLQTLLLKGDSADHVGESTEAVSRRAKELFGTDHAAVAAVLANWSFTLTQIGRAPEAKRALEKSLDILRQSQADPRLIATSLSAMARVDVQLEQYAKAEDEARQAINLLESSATSGKSLAETRQLLAEIFTAAGKFSDAEATLADACKDVEVALGADDRTTVTTLCGRAIWMGGHGSFEHAEPVLLRAVERARQVLGENDPMRLATLQSLWDLYASHNKYERAVELAPELVKLAEASPGPQQRALIGMQQQCGRGLMLAQRFADAKKLLLIAKSLATPSLPQSDPLRIQVLLDLVGCQLALEGPSPSSDSIVMEAVEALRSGSSNLEPTTFRLLGGYSAALITRRQYGKAEVILSDLVARGRKVFQRGSAEFTSIKRDLLDAKLHAKPVDSAWIRPFWLEILDDQRMLYEQGTKGFERSVLNAAEHFHTWGYDEDAARLSDEAVAIARKNMTPLDVAKRLSFASSVRLALAKPAEARTLAEEAVSLLVAKADPQDPGLAAARGGLADALIKLGKFAESEPIALQSFEALGEPSEANRNVRREALERLVRLYETWGQSEKAVEWRTKLAGEDK